MEDLFVSISPDLSPIENIWNVLKTQATMRDAMQEIWEGLEDDIRKILFSVFKSVVKFE